MHFQRNLVSLEMSRKVVTATRHFARQRCKDKKRTSIRKREEKRRRTLLFEQAVEKYIERRPAHSSGPTQCGRWLAAWVCGRTAEITLIRTREPKEMCIRWAYTGRKKLSLLYAYESDRTQEQICCTSR